MGCPSVVELGNNCAFSITTHDPDGILTDADSLPSYRLYEDEIGTPIASGTMSKVDDANTTGFYAETVPVTPEIGYEVGKTYTVYIEATVNGDRGGAAYSFSVVDTEAALDALVPVPGTGICQDIKEVFQDVGTAFTTLRDSGDITGEYLDFTLNRQVTKPFIRAFFLEASFYCDTESIAGDVIRFDTTGEKYLVMNKTPELFENAVITNECVLYKANVSGELSRPVAVRSPQTYLTEDVFSTVKAECTGLMTEQLFGHDLDTDEELGMIGLQKHELYVPSHVNPQPLDRYEGSSGEYFMVTTIKKRRFDAVWVCHLEEDTR